MLMTMRPYLRIFYCAILIYAISIAISLYTRDRQTEIESYILSAADFKFVDKNYDDGLNFYSISDQSIEDVYQKLNRSDIKILADIIKDDDKYRGPINYKLENMVTTISGNSSNFAVRINDSAKIAIHNMSFLLLEKFGSEGLKAIGDIYFLIQDSYAQRILLRILTDGKFDGKERVFFKKNLLSEIEKSEKFIEKFYGKYCSHFKNNCPSLLEFDNVVLDDLVKDTMNILKLEIDRYNNSIYVKNFDNSVNFLGVFPELKPRLCNNEKAAHLRSDQNKANWSSYCRI